MTPRQAKRLIGRTIVAVDLQSWWEGEGGSRVLLHDPKITFDDGSLLLFHSQENPEGGEAGVAMTHGPPRKK